MFEYDKFGDTELKKAMTEALDRIGHAVIVSSGGKVEVWEPDLHVDSEKEFLIRELVDDKDDIKHIASVPIAGGNFTEDAVEIATDNERDKALDIAIEHTEKLIAKRKKESNYCNGYGAWIADRELAQ